MAQTERLSHVYNVAGLTESGESQLLTDWAHLLNALMDAANSTGNGETYLHRARAVAELLIAKFHDPSNGGFFDVTSDPQAIGYLRVREKPLPENVAAAQGLLKLYQANGDERYLETAQRTLSAYVEVNRVYGEFAASYALTVDLAINQPIEVTIEGHLGNPDTQRMLSAAAQIAYPNLVIKIVEAPAENQALAHVCLNTICLPPVSNPSRLALIVAEAAAPHTSHFDDIFQQFGGV